MSLKEAGGWRTGSIITDMVLDMNESRVRTLAQLREVLAGTASPQFHRAQNDPGRYAWISAVLKRFGCRKQRRADLGAVLSPTCSA